VIDWPSILGQPSQAVSACLCPLAARPVSRGRSDRCLAFDLRRAGFALRPSKVSAWTPIKETAGYGFRLDLIPKIISADVVFAFVVFSCSSLTRCFAYLLPPRASRPSPVQRYSPP
jgi:hypothetical protein